MKNILLILMALLCACSVLNHERISESTLYPNIMGKSKPKRNLDRMSESKRNEWITKRAGEVVSKYCPKCNQGIPPFIVRDTTKSGPNKGKEFYYRAIYPKANQTKRETFTFSDSSGEVYTRDICSGIVSFDCKTGEVASFEDSYGRITMFDMKYMIDITKKK